MDDMFLKSPIGNECRNPIPKLQMCQLSSERHGLAESLLVSGSICVSNSPFYSKKKLAGKKGGLEADWRSAFAATGKAELAKFCAKLYLSPSVPKRSYNIHTEKIDETVLIHAQQKMREAALDYML